MVETANDLRGESTVTLDDLKRTVRIKLSHVRQVQAEYKLEGFGALWDAVDRHDVEIIAALVMRGLEPDSLSPDYSTVDDILDAEGFVLRDMGRLCIKQIGPLFFGLDFAQLEKREGGDSADPTETTGNGGSTPSPMPVAEAG